MKGFKPLHLPQNAGYNQNVYDWIQVLVLLTGLWYGGWEGCCDVWEVVRSMESVECERCCDALNSLNSEFAEWLNTELEFCSSEDSNFSSRWEFCSRNSRFSRSAVLNWNKCIGLYVFVIFFGHIKANESKVPWSFAILLPYPHKKNHLTQAISK